MFVVKEIFYTLQGEGMNFGRPAVFCRFAGCNLWNGKEEDREVADCNFCDTDFLGGTKYTREVLVQECNSLYKALNVGKQKEKLVVLTGGEPMLQVNKELIDMFHNFSFKVCLETNGTIEVCSGVDVICVSRKAETDLIQKSGDELKLVYPQKVNPRIYENLQFKHFLLQPKDNNNLQENAQICINYCLDNPKWRLSTQTHKLWGLR